MKKENCIQQNSRNFEHASSQGIESIERTCIFCKIVEGKIPAVKIWEDEKHMAMLDINPITKGHTLIIPKKHTEYLFDLNDKEYCELMLTAKKISNKLKSKLNIKKMGVIVEGFQMPHAHIHLIPINNGNEIRGQGKPISNEELKKIAKEIR